MHCNVCTYPCKTTVQRVTSCRDVCQRQGRTAACTENDSYEPQSGNAVGCASDTDIQGTLDTEHSTSLAWGKLVGAHSLYITFCFCILPPISYTAGQAKKHVDVQQELLNFCASEPKNKKGKPQENTKLHFNLDFSSDQIKKHPLLLPQHGF